jgi:hypothetical protein
MILLQILVGICGAVHSSNGIIRRLHDRLGLPADLLIADKARAAA